jgi:hypothetical protein
MGDFLLTTSFMKIYKDDKYIALISKEEEEEEEEGESGESYAIKLRFEINDMILGTTYLYKNEEKRNADFEKIESINVQKNINSLIDALKISTEKRG